MDIVAQIAELTGQPQLAIKRRIDRGNLVRAVVLKSGESGVTVKVPSGIDCTEHEQVFHIRSWEKICKGDTMGICVDRYESTVIFKPIAIISNTEAWKL